MNEHKFAPGAIVFRAGDPGVRAFLIREGTVELLAAGPAAKQLAVLGPGEVVGEMSLIEERPHALTARAVGAVKANGLGRDEFEKLLTADPVTFRTYLKSLFERLRVLSARVATAEGGPNLVDNAVTVTIHPITRRAAESLPEEGFPITKFPFRIGRASEAREQDLLDLNDLWLLDKEPFHVSRNHALVNQHDGAIIVEDRGSKRGTHVNDIHIGVRNEHTHAALEDGDNVVILGGLSSPYQFRIHVTRG